MSWSYDSTALDTHLNWIRFRIGDTDSTDPQISDEEIAGILAIEPRREFAAAQVLDSLAAKFAKFGAASAEADRFREMAAQIRSEAGPDYL